MPAAATSRSSYQHVPHRSVGRCYLWCCGCARLFGAQPLGAPVPQAGNRGRLCSGKAAAWCGCLCSKQRVEMSGSVHRATALRRSQVVILWDVLSFVISTSLRHQPAAHPSAAVGIHPSLVKERVWRADLGEKRSGRATCGQKQGEAGRKLPRAGSSSVLVVRSMPNTSGRQ